MEGVRKVTWDYATSQNRVSNTAAAELQGVHQACSQGLSRRDTLFLNFTSSCHTDQRNPSHAGDNVYVYQAPLPDDCVCATCSRFQSEVRVEPSYIERGHCCVES